MNVTVVSQYTIKSGQNEPVPTYSSAAIKEFAMLVGLNILLIEDKPTSSKQIQDVLRTYGYEPRLFWVEPKTDILAQLSSAPDIVIFAYKPSNPTEIDALNILNILKSQALNIPLILITDDLHESLAIECVKQGAADYVLKDRLNRLGLSIHQALVRQERDIEFNQSIEALRFSESLNYALIDVLPAHIAVLDRQGTIVRVNEAWQLFGNQNRSSSSAAATGVGVNYLDICWRASQSGDPSAAQAMLGIQAVLDGKQQEFSLEYPCNTPQETQWFKMTVIPLGTRDGGVVVSHTNVTERKRAETVNSNADQVTRELEQERKLRLRYLATLSHDLRTPLMIIKTSHALLTRYGDRLSAVQQDHHHHVINFQLEFLTDLVKDIITLDTANEGELKFNPAPLNIPAFCAQIIKEIEPIASAKHTLSLVLDDTPVTALLDEHLLQHALSNLLTNAVQYSPNGGTVMFTVRHDQDNLIFSVSDQGLGISGNDLPQLFDAFYRGANIKGIQGTGLGLAIVKSCVETHGGSISAESTLGVGTTFTISVPYR